MAVSLASAGSAVLRSSSNRSPRVQDGHLSPHRCWSGRIVTPQRLTQRLKAGPSDVLLLDFDGVIVDSEPEVCFLVEARLRLRPATLLKPKMCDRSLLAA